MASSSQARQGYDYDSDDSSGDSFDSEDESSPLQVALRDKEEALVQSALARIRRAQQKGKRDVKLNKEELDALEKRRKRMQSAATAKARKSNESGGSGSERRRRSDRNIVTVPLTAPVVAESSSRKKGKSRRIDEAPPHPPAATNPPGMLVAGPDGLAYAPIGYYPPQVGGSRNSPKRPRTSSTSHRGTPPPHFSYQPVQSIRNFSDGTRPNSSSSNGSRRPLPDEDGWIPAYSRRNSISSNPHGPDPFEYQTGIGHAPPIPQPYSTQSSRRNVSGPPEVAYSTVRRNPPPSSSSAGYPAAARAQASDHNLRRRTSGRDQVGGTSSRREEIVVHVSSDGSGSEEDDDDEEDDSDELGNGVQVFVEREPARERERPAPVSRKAVGGAGAGAGGVGGGGGGGRGGRKKEKGKGG